MTYEVVRITYCWQEGEVLGRYRFRWLARVHHWWANIGLRIAIIREWHPPTGSRVEYNGEPLSRFRSS